MPIQRSGETWQTDNELARFGSPSPANKNPRSAALYIEASNRPQKEVNPQLRQMNGRGWKKV
jgi:hypothetical protein